MTSETEAAIERIKRIRLYAQDMLDTGFLSAGMVGNAMSIRDEADVALAKIDRLTRELEAVREAARPFVELAMRREYLTEIDDTWISVRLRHFRRLASALESPNVD